MSKVRHILTFSKSLQSSADDLFDQFFPDLLSDQKKIISENDLFELTPIFNNLSKNNTKITLTSTDQGLLRMISHSLGLRDTKYAISFIGESAGNDSQFTYFIQNSQKNILILNKLAEQSHLDNTTYESPLTIRLGALRKDISRGRSFVADSEFLFFNINALKWSDSPAQAGNNPSGLTSEEANQLAYLAGQSHKNKFFVLYGFDNPEFDQYDLSLNSGMQLLWYYHRGATEKAQVWPIPETQQQDFIIESTMTSRNLLFRKDRLSGHWFHKIPFNLPPNLQHHKWIASSHEEYLASANEDLPDRLLAWYELSESN